MTDSVKNDRCDLSDLPVNQCACRVHTPVTLPRPTEFTIMARFDAHFYSRCDGCDDSIHEGDSIARTSYGEYICSKCSDPR